jgi:hypothetical protein
MDLFALATVTTGPGEAGGPPPTKFYEQQDNLQQEAGACLPPAFLPLCAVLLFCA